MKSRLPAPSSHAACRSWKSARSALGIASYAASRIRAWRKRKRSSSPTAWGRMNSLRTRAKRCAETAARWSSGTRSATARRGNSRPMTAARSITAVSSGSRRPRRTASSAAYGGWHSDVVSSGGRHCGHLLHEQRIALCGGRDPLPRGARSFQMLQELIGCVRVERAERQRLCSGIAPRPVGPLLEQLRPREAQDQQRDALDPAREVLDEIEERRLGPVHVVEADDQRTLASERLEPPPDLREDLLAGPSERFVGKDLPHGPERDSLPVREAAPDEDAGLARDAIEELSRQPRLADPGLAEHGTSCGCRVSTARAYAPCSSRSSPSVRPAVRRFAAGALSDVKSTSTSRCTVGRRLVSPSPQEAPQPWS